MKVIIFPDQSQELFDYEYFTLLQMILDHHLEGEVEGSGKAGETGRRKFN